MLKHPDTNRIREIMKAIIEARGENQYPEVVDMDSTGNPMCGTPGCHAGELLIGMIRTMDMSALANLENVIKYDYWSVAHMFAAYLFPDIELVDGDDLKRWAQHHPDLWGNSYGLHMFYSGAAFGQLEYTFPPSVITDHWLAVADRIDALAG